MSSRRPSVPDRFPLGGLGIDVIHGPEHDSEELQATPLVTISGFEFDRCPICLEPGPDRREHVPPASIGGQALTRTCTRCNSGLGARVEDELAAWLAGAVGHVRFTSEGSGVRGRRRVPPLLVRRTDGGQFVLIIDSKAPPEIRTMLEHGQFEVEMTPPQPHRYRIAALKQAYLGACIRLRDIPDTRSARLIRRDLLAARDASSNGSVPKSEIAASIVLARTYSEPAGPPLVLCRFIGEGHGRAMGLLFAGHLLVSWPFDDISAA